MKGLFKVKEKWMIYFLSIFILLNSTNIVAGTSVQVTSTIDHQSEAPSGIYQSLKNTMSWTCDQTLNVFSHPLMKSLIMIAVAGGVFLYLENTSDRDHLSFLWNTTNTTDTTHINPEAEAPTNINLIEQNDEKMMNATSLAFEGVWNKIMEYPFNKDISFAQLKSAIKSLTRDIHPDKLNLYGELSESATEKGRQMWHIYSDLRGYFDRRGYFK